MSNHLKGPAAVAKQMIDAGVELKKALRHATTASERKLIQDQIVLVSNVLRDLRRKRACPKMYREVDDLTDRMRVMARLAKAMGRGRDVIYHGTRALPAVMRTGKLVPPEFGECAVFFTRSAEVAAYFACLMGEREERRVPGLLVIERASLRQCYRLEPHRYDPLRDRNEREETVWCRIINYRRHLIGIVSDRDVTAVLGAPKRRYLSQGFLRWPAARRRKFIEREEKAGRALVRPGRAAVRELIIGQRETPQSRRPVERFEEGKRQTSSNASMPAWGLN
jgi:CBS domain-containing protein